MPRRTTTFVSGTFARADARVTFSRLKKHFPKKSWLGTTNRYAKKCTEFIKRDCDNPPHRIVGARENQLSEYIAASAPTHCIDGWGLLGRALASHSLGDAESTKHFSYYAQLRAVMSLMASEGVGIFKNKHFSIGSATRRSSKISGPWNGNTHEFAMNQFSAWAKSQDSANLFEKTIQPRGRTLDTWFSEISTTRMTALAAHWLEEWGYDLRVFEDDKSARHNASYRPASLREDLEDRNAPRIGDTIDVIKSVWRMCSPDTAGGMNMDLYLLRLSWEQHLRVSGRTLDESEARRVLTNMGIAEPELTTLAKFFDRTSQPLDPILFQMASKKGDLFDTDYHLQMMCRAVLLLRIASGSARQMVEAAQLTKTDLEFWWSAIGENRGFWEAGATDPLSYIWDEIEDALQGIDAAASPAQNHFQWRSQFASEILSLSGCERIGLSQLCL